MSMDWVRKNYGVPAKRGGRIEYTGEGAGQVEHGTITGTTSGHLSIRLDGQKHSMPFHPTWRLRYLDAEVRADRICNAPDPEFAVRVADLTKVEP